MQPESNEQHFTTERRVAGDRLGLLAKSFRLAQWSFRKIHLPIRASDLVLDVGSGASPHPRADVLLERYASGAHRHGTAAVVNRPTVFADACRMPFKDKAFDYVIAFHILEHIPTPEVFLKELMRVAKAGYIETPNVMFERIAPYTVHCLEIMDINGRLLIHKKAAPTTDPFLTHLSESSRWNAFFYRNPRYFHVCYHWRDRIEFEVVNPDETCSWYMREIEDGPTAETVSSAATLGPRGAAIEALRRFYALRRKTPVHLRGLLVCPECHGGLTDEANGLACRPCGKNYPSQPWPTFV